MPFPRGIGLFFFSFSLLFFLPSSTTGLQVAYFYDPEVGNYYYGQTHPMKPHRIRMTHNLLLNYGLYEHLEIYRPSPARDDELTRFHSDEYIEFLRLITPDNQHEHLRQLKRYNVGEDCPVFDGLYQFCKCYTGGSIGGAVKVSLSPPPRWPPGRSAGPHSRARTTTLTASFSFPYPLPLKKKKKKRKPSLS